MPIVISPRFTVSKKKERERKQEPRREGKLPSLKLTKRKYQSLLNSSQQDHPQGAYQSGKVRISQEKSGIEKWSGKVRN